MSVAVRFRPPPGESSRGGGSAWVRLCHAHNDIDARLLTGRLAEAGIETRSIKDRNGPGAWLYGGANPWAPVTVYVREFQLEDARLALAEVAWEAPAAPSPDAANARVRTTPLRWWATAIALGLILSGMALAQVAGAAGVCQLRIFCDATSGR